MLGLQQRGCFSKLIEIGTLFRFLQVATVLTPLNPGVFLSKTVFYFDKANKGTYFELFYCSSIL